MKTIENTSFKANENTNDNLNKVEQEIELLKQENEELKAKLKYYEEQFKLAQAKKYGSSSDSVADGQISIFNEAEKESAKECVEPDIEEITYKRKKSATKSRRSYKDLEVEEVYYTLPEEEQTCPSCNHELHELHEMKVVVRKELKVIPPTVKVVHHKRQVYACRHCDSMESEGTEGSIITAPMPKPVLPGSMVSPSLLATILDMKFNKMMPLYRQEQSFVDFGIDISRQNMASWVVKGSEQWLKPLFLRMCDYLIKEDIVHADETVLNCLDEKDNKNNYMWLYATGERSNHRIYLYDYQKSRSQKHPKEFLEGFSGYLQTDGYQGYNSVSNVKNLGCLAHARRYFTDALKALTEDATATRTKAHEGEQFFSKIYAYERDFKEISSEGRYTLRLEKVKPVLDDLHLWLETESKRTLPKSKLGEAIKYSLKQWDKLIQFLEDGRLSCDNNLAERGIKPFVLARKNFLFAKSPKGATASGIAFSIIETAKANGLKPFYYLNYLFEKLPNINLDDYDALDACLPWSESLPEEIRRKTESIDENN
ncbi:transposase [Geosporobacter subterraneus DSM 17957]|uniref:Transposase n=1 Tax=Geosporobacter subterraneus DSM 17957 TaxID=1121919 RepID=A0A1M6QR71_9FIRM|nr:IS66 family transposase [Geosporobacter subterraneus]SHK22789.1 transposase [Geosporobacter subterraneus DSM 17957]